MHCRAGSEEWARSKANSRCARNLSGQRVHPRHDAKSRLLFSCRSEPRWLPLSYPPFMKRPRFILLTSALLTAGLAGFWLVNTSRAATETPEHTVIRSQPPFEIRDYPALNLATSPMEADGIQGGFGALFGFITGKNQSGSKLAMTAPVLIDNTTQQKRMSFILPKGAAENGVPQPLDTSVQLGQLPPDRYAVLRFEGGRSAQNEQNAIEKLRAWMEKQRLKGKGVPLLAYYDPPWTPVFLRRNEVLIRIEKPRE